jgi:hypothetical protein
MTAHPILCSGVFGFTMKSSRAFRLQYFFVFVTLFALHVVHAERFFASPTSNSVARYSGEVTPECQAIRQFRSKSIEQSLINDGNPFLLT